MRRILKSEEEAEGRKGGDANRNNNDSGARSNE